MYDKKIMGALAVTSGLSSCDGITSYQRAERRPFGTTISYRQGG